jgi:hypothetical protein
MSNNAEKLAFAHIELTNLVTDVLTSHDQEGCSPDVTVVSAVALEKLRSFIGGDVGTPFLPQEIEEETIAYNLEDHREKGE